MLEILMVLGSILVVFEVNPVQALLWLIAVFLFSALVMLEAGGEFIAILVVLVYIGAIAVLFLFVIMFLNIRLMELNMYYTKYTYIIGLFSFLLIGEILFLLYLSKSFSLVTVDSLLVVDFT
jgi:NADH-quinone oxidoreductase subunit J